MQSNYLLVLFLLLLRNDQVQPYCKEFPYGHICRNMDLTGFCLQVSHMLRIRNNEKLIKPYPQFETIFSKLENIVGGIRPFVHFGAYHRPTDFFHEKTCINEKTESCFQSVNGATPPPAVSAAPPIRFCRMCEKPGLLKGVDSTPDGAKCDPNCNCCIEPPVDSEASGTIFSLQDGCELKYLKAPIEKMGTRLYDLVLNQNAKENPYKLEITEISINGTGSKITRLHNWLHIRIHYEEGPNTFKDTSDKGALGHGRIKMGFIMAHDAMGFPVGEFVNSIDCGRDCNCKEPDCYQGKRQDAFPCMFDGTRVVSNTGMMMFHASDARYDTGYKEIHATWRYSQPRHPDNFHTELHFHALIVDDFNSNLSMPVSNQANTTARISAISELHIPKKGMFGWNPMYTILHPTNLTIGAYDYYREDSFLKNEIYCHRPIAPEHYMKEPYPDSGPKIRKIPTGKAVNEHCYRLNNTFEFNPPFTNVECGGASGTERVPRYPVPCPSENGKLSEPQFRDTFGFTVGGKVDQSQVYPWTLFGARTEAYVIRDGGLNPKNWRSYDPQDPDTTRHSSNTKLYFGTYPGNQNSLQYKECAVNQVDGSDNDKWYGQNHLHVYPLPKDGYEFTAYGHFCRVNAIGRRVRNLPGPTYEWHNILARIWKLPPVSTKSYETDRCYCPTIPATPDPRYREPPETQIQGRKQHATQMIIAWNCIVPFSIFVSRYYKETYSKVMFLQEYWWYTTHVLCMVSAAMFTFGGIYVMELKRRDPINWLDSNITVHVIMGYTIIALFGFQVCTGFFRVRDVKKRIVNIFMHWLLGVLEYIMAVACMINSSFILLSGMTCAGVVALGCLLGFQVMFYASMEVHMRSVDKQMQLKPPRSYLPPPVMRVFHKDAPESKFRIFVLLAYLILCMSTSVIQFYAMESNQEGESCFIKSEKYLEEEARAAAGEN